ncbi:MAG: toll/interleukin-1 receptor domain-containing protein [Pseudomonadota bacterium]
MARILRQCLESGTVVEIDGLGTFRPAGRGGFVFEPDTQPRIFLAYVEEDLVPVRKLYQRLEAEGYRPWLDKEKLLPGQNWPRSIERTIEVSDFFVACFSSHAESKRGHFHCELRFALECAQRMPLEDVFFIPVRLDECTVPRRITQQIQYVDLFEDWERGVQRVIKTIERQQAHRNRARQRPR